MSVSYIPTKESLLGPWVANFSSLIAATPGAYGLMASDAATIATYVNSFTAALALVLNPATKTKSSVADKNGKKTAMLSIVRQYAKVIKSNLGVSNEAKIDLGLHINDTTRSPVPAPTTEPVLLVNNGAPLQQAIRFSDVTTPDKKGKPAGVTTLVLVVAVAETPPANPDALPLRALVTRQNHVVTFDPADKAKTAYYFGRWATAGGLMGPWSALAQQLVA